MGRRPNSWTPPVEPGEVVEPVLSAEDRVAAAPSAALPVMLAKAKASGDQVTVDAILRRCSV